MIVTQQYLNQLIVLSFVGGSVFLALAVGLYYLLWRACGSPRPVRAVRTLIRDLRQERLEGQLAIVGPLPTGAIDLRTGTHTPPPPERNYH